VKGCCEHGNEHLGYMKCGVEAFLSRRSLDTRSLFIIKHISERSTSYEMCFHCEHGNVCRRTVIVNIHAFLQALISKPIYKIKFH
jgi:hypothetical protein